MTALLLAAADASAVAAEVSSRTVFDRMTLVMVDIGIVVIVAGMLLCIARLLRGPHLSDRAVAVDTITLHLVGLVVLLTMRIGRLVFFDGVLALSLLGFVSSVAMGQYIIRKRLKELHVHEEIPTGDDSPLAGPSAEKGDGHG